MQNRFFAFTFDQFKDRLIAGRVMGEFQTFAGQFGYNFFDRSRFVQLYQSAASATPVRPHWRFAQRKQFLTKLGVEQIQVEILLMKFAHRFLVMKIVYGLLVSLAHFYQIRWKLGRLRVSFGKISFEIRILFSRASSSTYSSRFFRLIWYSGGCAM